MSDRTKARLEELQQMLVGDIDVKKLRTFCHRGVPDKPGMRSVAWKLLLNYLPLSSDRWEGFLERQRELYSEFVRDFIINTHDDKGGSSAGVDDPLGAAVVDDPLGALSLADEDAVAAGGSASAEAGHTKKGSKWDEYFKENRILEQIDKDVRRLNPEFAFYQTTTGMDRPTPSPLRLRVNTTVLASETLATDRSGKLKRKVSSSSNCGVEEPEGMDEAHWEVIGRILFIHAKLNPGLGYVQGMNEILGPIYYVLATDPDPKYHRRAEADAFWCFTALMAELRDVFIKTLDDSSTGVGALMARLVSYLEEVDAPLARAMDEMKLMPQFYAFRWMTLLLSQEFQLPDVLRLWDSIFAAKDRIQYLIYLCVGMLQHVRTTLLERDFATSLKMLQKYPEVDVGRLIALADKLVEREAHKARHEEYLRTGKLR